MGDVLSCSMARLTIRQLGGRRYSTGTDGGNDISMKREGNPFIMHRRKLTSELKDLKQSGILYVVATPIGNMADITLRAVETLRSVSLVAAEDTRHTRRLLSYHEIRKPLISYHEYNEIKRSAELVSRLFAGESVALVSNAGTPTISDPGYRLVKEAVARNIKVVPIPGVSASVAALSASGMPTDTFVFLGFLSRKKGKRIKDLEQLIAERRTMIFYESPRRILGLLCDMQGILGNRYGVLAREMTKQYEEFIYGRLGEIIEAVKSRVELKGECTLVIAADEEKDEGFPREAKKDIVKALTDGHTRLADMAGELADRYNLSKKEVYQEALKLKKSIDESG